jgi:hypothetical protein
MTDRLFHPDELQALATPYPLLIQKKIRSGSIKEALGLCREMKDSQVDLHDLYAASCTVLWSWVGNTIGEEAVEALFRYVFNHSAARQFFDAACAMAPPHLSVILLAKSWRAHSCFESGDHPGKFHIHEDTEKFSFRLNPCGSGSRLWKNGWYKPDKGGLVSQQARTWTYQRKGFPYYCMHCPFLNEILPFESAYGTLMWPVDPPGTPDDSCEWHIYKDRNRIPDRYYERFGLKKKPAPKNKYLDDKRTYFSKSELDRMSMSSTDRIYESISNGDYTAAVNLCSQARDEFLVLHDLYVNMLVTTLTFISEKTGESGLEDALSVQYEKCVRNQLIKKICGLSVKGKIRFLSQKIFGADACNQTGYHKGQFHMTETDSEFVFTLNPCGSGGRLIRSGAYSPMPYLKKKRETIEKAIICWASRQLPVPEGIFKLLFPYIVNHFTQRKPFGQGKTQKAHLWSFSMTNVPYFCCQCGMLYEQFKNKGLSIKPPMGKEKKCIWRIDKHFLEKLDPPPF